MKIYALRLLFVYTSIRHNVNPCWRFDIPKEFPDQCTTIPPLSPAQCDAVGHCTHACKGNSLPPIYSWYLGTIEKGFERCSHLDCDEAIHQPDLAWSKDLYTQRMASQTWLEWLYCAHCPANYVEETKRKLSKRLEEHQRADSQL